MGWVSTVNIASKTAARSITRGSRLATRIVRGKGIGCGEMLAGRKRSGKPITRCYIDLANFGRSCTNRQSSSLLSVESIISTGWFRIKINVKDKVYQKPKKTQSSSQNSQSCPQSFLQSCFQSCSQDCSQSRSQIFMQNYSQSCLQDF